MDGKRHAKIFYSIILTPLIILLVYIDKWEFIPLAIISALVYDPDKDNVLFKGKYHRSFITHSLLWCIIITVPFYWFDLELLMEGLFVSSFAVIIHLFLDLFGPNDEDNYRLFGINRVGKYCIRFFKRRLSGGWTVVWFIVNILIMVIYDVWFITI